MSSVHSLKTGQKSDHGVIQATRQFAKDDTMTSWWLLSTTLCLLGLACAGTLVAPGIFLKASCSVLTGLLLVRAFVIYHDHQHGAILPKSKFGQVLMQWYGIVSISPASIWKHSHNHHHHHNCTLHDVQIGSFPVLTLREYEALAPPQRRSYLIARHPAVVLLGYVSVFLWGMCLKPFWNNPRRHWDGGMALLLHGACAWALISGGGVSAWLLAQTVPFLVACGLGTYLFYAQHNFPTVHFADEATWSYENAALRSTCYMRMGPVMRWFTANISYHHLHHLNAKIPFYRLPEAMARIPMTQNPPTTSLALRDVRACFRLKLWDETRQQMIPLPR